MKQELNIVGEILPSGGVLFVSPSRSERKKLNEQLASDWIAQINQGVTELHVRCNQPFENLEAMVSFLEYCQKNRTPLVSLDFRGDDFNQLKPLIEKLMLSIPLTVTSLHLSLSALGDAKDWGRKFGAIFSKIPKTITMLNLSDHEVTQDQLIFKESSVILNDDEVVAMNDEQRRALAKRLSLGFNQLYFVDKKGTVLHDYKSKAQPLIEPLFDKKVDYVLFRKYKNPT